MFIPQVPVDTLNGDFTDLIEILLLQGHLTLPNYEYTRFIVESSEEKNHSIDGHSLWESIINFCGKKCSRITTSLTYSTSSTPKLSEKVL